MQKREVASFSFLESLSGSLRLGLLSGLTYPMGADLWWVREESDPLTNIQETIWGGGALEKNTRPHAVLFPVLCAVLHKNCILHLRLVRVGSDASRLITENISSYYISGIYLSLSKSFCPLLSPTEFPLLPQCLVILSNFVSVAQSWFSQDDGY